MIHIRVVSFNGQPPTQALGYEFDELGGSIGRADTNQLVLADPERQVSRLQARVVWRNGSFELINVGVNAVGVGGRSIANGNATPIRAGDRIEIGGYVLEVVAPEATAMPEATARAPGPVDDPLGLFGEAGLDAGGSDPFAEILGSGKAAGARPASPVESTAPSGPLADPFAVSLSPAAVKPANSGVIPDDFDPFADPFAPPPAAQEAAAGSLDELGFGPGGETAAGPGINTMFGLGPAMPAGKVDPFAGSELGEPSPGAAVGGDMLDPLAALSGAPLRGPGAAPVPDQVPELHGSYRPPRAAAEGTAFLSWEEGAHAGGVSKATVDSRAEPKPVPARGDEVELSFAPPPHGAAARGASGAAAMSDTTGTAHGETGPAGGKATAVSRADALAQAFVTGLGVPDLPLPPQMTPEMMERIGRLLREATQGTLDLLLARAMTKREVRAELTMIVSRDNNPLKFSPSVEVALMHLLAAQGRGFLPPVEAMRDAYDDLRAHELGFMAGLRAALAGVLARFDPAMLEQRLSEKTVLDSLLPMNRRAKLWDLYTELYRDIASEAEDDFHALFGREFRRAYEEQVKRLSQRDT